MSNEFRPNQPQYNEMLHLTSIGRHYVKSYGIVEYNGGMPRYIEVKADLDEKELEKRYRAGRDGVERSQWQILWLLRGGKRAREVADLTGYSVVWIRALVKRYNAGGPATIGDRRHKNPGRPLKLNAEQQASLKAELMKAEAATEPWSGVQVAAWMSQALGKPVYAVRGWEMLQRWGFKRKVPRPRHVKANQPEQTEFKKT